jgi:hypothetical protein
MAGRPAGSENKDKPFRDALRMEITEAGEDRKRLRTVARALLDKAEGGDVAAIKEVADRLDGKPAQSHEHSGEGGGPITLTWLKS